MPSECSREMASRLAKLKAQAIYKGLENTDERRLIIGSDQVACLKDSPYSPIGKPGNIENARRQLLSFSGNAVDFHTALCVLNTSDGQFKLHRDETTVHFRNLTESQITHYLEVEKPFDCAGSFKSEALGIALFEKIETEDPNALIGLPLIGLCSLLQEFGLDVLAAQ